MTIAASHDAATEHISREELQRMVAAQRAAFLREGPPSAETRRRRIDRLMLAVLEAADDLAEALNQDYGTRPVGLTKLFDLMAWVGDAKETRDNLEKWMRSIPLDGPVPAVIDQKPKGVVGVMGAWNFPITLTIQPAFAALGAGNRVIMKFPEFHRRTGKVFRDAVARYFGEDEVAVVVGDLRTAQAFSELQLDHLVLTGSPAVGRAVAAAAGKNLVPLTLELGGKNPVVVADDVDLDLAAHRVAIGRMMNSGQVCLCPDYVFVPRGQHDLFVAKLEGAFRRAFPSYLDNPGVVSIVNGRNYDRIVALIDDAVAKGATKVQIATPTEADQLPSRESRLIPPTILVDVPENATISSEEIFGPVIAVYPYDDVAEVVSYINARPTPLGAYWYGEDTDDFRNFLHRTNSGGVTRNDTFAHQAVAGAPFGGVGGSGYGAYHGKVGFDEFTHRRTVASPVDERSFVDGTIGAVVGSSEVEAGIDQAIAAEIADIRGRLGG
ncbi:aldehyde dehydrogenase family protein [Rhodococcus sp. T7]|uniref:aldehyde dehydrogenase family protein n=1 Tax=Rhodococcus sp. T7 TaxID=627444 RepID=UPI0013CA7969|nr:Coniferyl aldehyde dehydrogenase [Rhodococcus sp. T7]KAF0963481.1 Coniferyl aldehyde dehydrogenase [Rhodococcus sp. T7]